MSNIRVDVGYTIKDGTEIKFRSPVDCAAITGLIVYYPGSNGNITSKVFAFADAHGNNVGDIDHLFAENVVVKVILDVTTSMAFVQNADTNAYLEAQLASKRPNTWLPTIAEIGAAPAGYGLGTIATDCGDCNALLPTGFYQLGTGTLNKPAGNEFTYAVMLNLWRKDRMIVQICYGISGSNNIAIRQIYGWSEGEWGEWERFDASAFAPAGYGLGVGELLPDGTDLNTIRKNGWYYWYSAVNAHESRFANMRVWTMDGGACMQESVSLSNDAYWGTMIRRMIYNSNIITPWEYVNPPMIPGVEYRTTERHQGKPVWTAVINCGSMPAGGTEEVSIAWLNASHILSCNGYMVDVGGNDSYNLPFNGYTVAARYHKIYKSADYDASMYNCYLTLEYTKTTD